MQKTTEIGDRISRGMMGERKAGKAILRSGRK
jgi:hypothetical protein